MEDKGKAGRFQMGPTEHKENDMKQNEARGQLVADALTACSTLDQRSPERDAIWFAIRDTICTRGLCVVTPLGSSTSIEVTAEHATDELIAAMEWLIGHEAEARQLGAHSLFIKLRGVATRGSSGSARSAQQDSLHGLTHVSPGQPVVFTNDDRDVAS